MADKATISWLRASLGEKRSYVITLAVVQGLYGATGVLYALFLRDIVDAAVAGQAGVFWQSLLFLVLLVFVQVGLRAIVRRVTELAKSTYENILKGNLTETLFRKDFLSVSATHSGDWLNRLTNDTVVVANGCVDIIPGALETLVKLVCAAVMIAVLEPRLALILLVVGVAMLLLTWVFRKTMKRLHKEVQTADGRVRITLQEYLENLAIVRAFSAEKQAKADADARMGEHKTARMRKNRFSNIANSGFSLGMNGLFVLGVGWCGYGILQGTISFGTLTAIVQLITQIQSPVANLTGYLPRWYAMLASAERLMEAEDLPDDAAMVKPLDEMLAFYDTSFKAVGFDHVQFSYDAEADADALGAAESRITLSDLTFEVEKGDFVAFAGRSGIGKSTALRLLMCLYHPESGERYLADANGERHALTADCRRLFSYVPQGNGLMSGTIRQIVSFSDPDASTDEARLANALRVACADDFVAELPQGADTTLGERGSGLSEGQMQRLAIARAVFSGSPILLLDEATSALDEGTERRLLTNLRDMTDKTVVMVTHRPAALDFCNKVVDFPEEAES